VKRGEDDSRRMASRLCIPKEIEGIGEAETWLEKMKKKKNKVLGMAAKGV